MTLDEDEENPSSMRKKDSKKIAVELFDATCRKENCHPDFVHSDNGEPMKGITHYAHFIINWELFLAFHVQESVMTIRILNHSSRQQNIRLATRNVFIR